MSSSSNNYNINITPPAGGNQSQKIEIKPTNKEVHQALDKVGKHGKSHHTYMKIMTEHQMVKQRPISSKELSQHTLAESAWLSLSGIVYDVTIYLEYHPGGKIILKGCGKECSQLFNQYHPWVNAKHLLQNYRIGYLSD